MLAYQFEWARRAKEIYPADPWVHDQVADALLVQGEFQEALEIELGERRVSFEPQKELRIRYKRRVLKKTYTADLIAFGKVIVELKALDKLTSREESQLLNYLKATGLEVGVLINFGAEDKLEWKRLVKTKKRSANNANLRE